MNISLIIPAYNEEELIGDTLKSVVQARIYYEKMTNKKMEIIVVDNESEDRTVEISEKYDVKIFNESNHNISMVRNKGALLPLEKFCVFLMQILR